MQSMRCPRAGQRHRPLSIFIFIAEGFGQDDDPVE